VGLHIGSRTPAEIAIAILAALIAERHHAVRVVHEVTAASAHD